MSFCPVAVSYRGRELAGKARVVQRADLSPLGRAAWGKKGWNLNQWGEGWGAAP